MRLQIFLTAALLLSGGGIKADDANLTYKKFDFNALTPSQEKAFDIFHKAFKARIERDLAHLGKAKAQEIAVKMLEGRISVREGKPNLNFEILSELHHEYPKEPIFIWNLALQYYSRNEAMPFDQTEQRLKILEEGKGFTEQCVKLAPENADCWLSWVAIHARTAALRGIFAQLFSVSEIYDAMEKAYVLAKKDPFPYGINMNNFGQASFALIEFYRVLPDSFFFKVITGKRGDKQKSYEYAKALKADTHNQNLTTFAAFAKAALCHGGRVQDKAIVDAGVAALKGGLTMSLGSVVDQDANRRIIDTYKELKALPSHEDFDKIAEIGCKDYGSEKIKKQ